MNFELLEQLKCANCENGSFAGLHTAIVLLKKNESVDLQCASCKKSYKVHGDIPRFVPESNYADSFGFQWNEHAATQLDSHCNV